MFSKVFSSTLVAFAIVTTFAHAAEQVEIQLSGAIGKFVSIASDRTNRVLDLESNYDQATGVLAAADYDIANIDSLSNSKDGYQIKVSTSNGYQLVDDDGNVIEYLLVLDGATKTPDNGTFNEVESNDAIILDVGASNTFNENRMEAGKLVLKSEAMKDFVLGAGTFTDTIQMTIVAK